jgi:hypothetical protein
VLKQERISQALPNWRVRHYQSGLQSQGRSRNRNGLADIPGAGIYPFPDWRQAGLLGKNLTPKDDKPSLIPALFAEMFARFPGKNSEYWYLSDGGHFENTGVYPLLKRRVKTIVVADCGADPEFIFDDLENLVRKARIDYGISSLLIHQPSRCLFLSTT